MLIKSICFSIGEKLVPFSFLVNHLKIVLNVLQKNYPFGGYIKYCTIPTKESEFSKSYRRKFSDDVFNLSLIVMVPSQHLQYFEADKLVINKLLMTVVSTQMSIIPLLKTEKIQNVHHKVHLYLMNLLLNFIYSVVNFHYLLERISFFLKRINIQYILNNKI